MEARKLDDLSDGELHALLEAVVDELKSRFENTYTDYECASVISNA